MLFDEARDQTRRLGVFHDLAQPADGGLVPFMRTDGLLYGRELARQDAVAGIGLDDIDLVELNEEGFIKVDCYSRTNVPGLFAAGDVTSTMAEQVLVAVGEGVKAALSAYEFLLRAE